MSRAYRDPVSVIAIEGIHGVGKTSYLDGLVLKDGEMIIWEEFVGSESPSNIDKQGQMREFLWLAKWFKRVIKTIDQYPHITKIYIDRSPYSAFIYSTCGGTFLGTLASDMIRGLAFEGIATVRIVGLRRDKEQIWKDIQTRLDSERIGLREEDRSHFDSVWASYVDAGWIDDWIDLPALK